MIDYALIDRAIRFYTDRGYQRIETPWLVSKDIADLTKPLNASTYIVQKDTEQKQKAFVASGEQSFLYLINKGYLPGVGRYQTVTPCLRDDAWDVTHMKNFVKLELIEYACRSPNVDSLVLRENNKLYVERAVSVALSFFETLVDKNDLEVVDTSAGYSVSYDINFNGIEIGSYGFRSCVFCDWVYATGIAEPRFSRLRNSKGLI